jgi:hypothetical protein
MRAVVLLIAAILLEPVRASASDLKPLFDAAQRLGNDTELRGDIVDRLGFGEDDLPIKDLVVTAKGVQHAVNAFMVGDKPYVLFDSHLYAPEVYIFVRTTDGTFVSGIHGRQYQPITNTSAMTAGNDAPVVGDEEAFWTQWLADRAKLTPPAK